MTEIYPDNYLEEKYNKMTESQRYVFWCKSMYRNGGLISLIKLHKGIIYIWLIKKGILKIKKKK